MYSRQSILVDVDSVARSELYSLAKSNPKTKTKDADLNKPRGGGYIVYSRRSFLVDIGSVARSELYSLAKRSQDKIKRRAGQQATKEGHTGPPTHGIPRRFGGCCIYIHFRVLLMEVALMAWDVRVLTLHGCVGRPNKTRQDKDEERWEVLDGL